MSDSFRPDLPKDFEDIPQYDPESNTLSLQDGNQVSLEIMTGTSDFRIVFDFNGKHYDDLFRTSLAMMYVNTSALGVLKAIADNMTLEKLASWFNEQREAERIDMDES